MRPVIISRPAYALLRKGLKYVMPRPAVFTLRDGLKAASITELCYFCKESRKDDVAVKSANRFSAFAPLRR